MEITKVEFQGLELDPNKTYIVNLHFDTGVDVEKRYYLFKHYKREFETKGFTNIIFNPYTDLCKLEVMEANEDNAKS
jgi:hypothetical protein